MNEESKRYYPTGNILGGLSGWSGSDNEYFQKVFSGRDYIEMTVDEARKLLNERLGEKSLSDLIRQDRDNA